MAVRTFPILAENPNLYTSEWAFDARGDSLIYVTPADKSVHIWSISGLDARPRKLDLDMEPLAVANLSVGPTDHMLCVGGRAAIGGGPIRLFGSAGDQPTSELDWYRVEPPMGLDLPNGEVWKVLPGKERFLCLGSSPEQGSFVLRISTKGEQELVQITPLIPEAVPTDMAVDPANDDIVYLTTGEGRSVEMWDLSRRHRIESLRPDDVDIFKPTKIKLEPETSRIWVSSFNMMRFVDRENNWGTPIQVTGPDDCVNDFDFGPKSGQVYAACTYSNRVALVGMGSINYINSASPHLVATSQGNVYVLGRSGRNEILTVLDD